MTSLGVARGNTLLLISLMCAACQHTPIAMNPALTPRPERTGSPLLAGFAKVDITPPVDRGLGLAGNGPESREGKGYRLRLYAKVLVLQDAAGERLALVVADLPLGSAVLQRQVTELTVKDGIGVDRLMLAMTHTHSGVSHYFDAGAYNDLASAVHGYDSTVANTLARRIAGAVHAAVSHLKPAKVAWGSTAIWGQTRIRSMQAMRDNIPPPEPLETPPVGLATDYALVDPRLTMLRVDVQEPGQSDFRPAGTFSVFAMHGTGNSPHTELFDADIQGIVERRLERHADTIAKIDTFRFVPRATSLFANGTEGDVSPVWPEQSRCAPPTLRTVSTLALPSMWQQWRWADPTPVQLGLCLDAARRSIANIADTISMKAVALFDQLGGRLSSQLTLKRAMTTLSFDTDWQSLNVCEVPDVGLATFAGGDDGVTRVRGMKLLGVIDVGLEQGSLSPIPNGCHQGKRLLLGQIGSRKISRTSFANFAQVSVFEVGDVVIAGLPAEITTTVGRRMRDSMLAIARRAQPSVKQALVMSHVDGYLEYVTTRDEYAAQMYEGGSTLYGPGEAEMFIDQVGRLVRNLSSGDRLPDYVAPPRTIDVGSHRSTDPVRGVEVAPSISSVRCSGDTAYVRVTFGRRGDWIGDVDGLRTEPHVRIDTVGVSGGWPIAWDDHPDVELWAVGHKRNAIEWELRWSHVPRGDFEIVAGSASRTLSCSYLE